MNELSIGKEVWWEDPAGQTSGIYVVDEIKREEGEGLYDDTIVLISNDSSEAEVMAGELQDLEHRRKCIADFVNRVTEIAEEDDWSVHNYDKEFNKVDLEFGKYSSMGQDFTFNVRCETGAVDELINAIDGYYHSYDPYEETTLWLGPDGHGKNGAPHDLEDLISDMKECKENIKDLADTFREELKGIKKLRPTLNSQYSDQLNTVRKEVITSIYETLYRICKIRGFRSITWEVLTNEEYPDICVASEGENWCNLPEVIALDDDAPNSFYIVFAAHCDCPNSYNGENIYTETLIEILTYLENYLSKISK